MHVITKDVVDFGDDDDGDSEDYDDEEDGKKP